MMLEGTPFLTLRGGVLYLYRCRIEITTPAIVHIMSRVPANTRLTTPIFAVYI
jgi:hypothetical protein